MSETDSNLARLEVAADWFEQRAVGVVDEVEFDRWLRDPRNMEAWLAICDSDATIEPLRIARKILKEMDGITQARTAANDDKAMRRGGPEKLKQVTKPGRGALNRRRLFVILTGAVTAGLVGTGALVANAKQSIETGVGERRQIALPDGSKLDVNTDSKVLWRFGAAKHEVWLERGEAALVASKVKRPITVKAEGWAVIALTEGQYNLRRQGDALSVTVLHGDAEVTTAVGKVKSVHMGDAVVMENAGLQIHPVASSELQKATLWRTGQLAFDGVTLAQAVEEYNRYLITKITIRDKSLGNIRLLATGPWSTDDPKEFLDTLAASFNVKVTRSASGEYVISKFL
ncbi:FecR family protein [Asticcacaulis endophyticus]|uniref:FecR protein domain-containing protein n=1 Tax=Asticcacaulis endophyticus TaxID=1395890 RepID=A0A918UTA7_9CAUL|nr:FecR domain-containing protein [Asticcacaulis endophyticus]GGZ32402.1 hypothetical protein GCM10011273_18180 [Asticcacaulis endophyticus]